LLVLEQVAALVYALTMTLMGFSFGGAWLYVARRVHLGSLAELAPGEVRARTGFVVGAPL
jgi:hypothetical protein